MRGRPAWALIGAGRALVQRLDPAHHRRDLEPLSRRVLAFRSKCGPALGRVAQREEHRRQCFVVAGGEDEGVPARGDDLGDPGLLARDQRGARGQDLDRGDAERLQARGADGDVERGEAILQIGPRAGERDAIGDP